MQRTFGYRWNQEMCELTLHEKCYNDIQQNANRKDHKQNKVNVNNDWVRKCTCVQENSEEIEEE